MDREKQLNKQWVEHWRKSGPVLEEIRREELRNYVHEEHLAAIDGLLQMGVEHGTRKTTSGLVELQRRLAMGRRSGM